MANREIKITFPEVKMEALVFFLQEANTNVEAVLREHLDKTYEKMVPVAVRKFVESKLNDLNSTEVQEDTVRTTGESTRPRGRRTRQERLQAETVNEAVEEGILSEEVQPQGIEEQDEPAGMVMNM